MATGFRVRNNDEFLRWLDQYRRHPWLVSAAIALPIGLVVGSSRSWLSGAIAAGALFLAFRVVIGPYAARTSRTSTEHDAPRDANPFT